MYPSSITVMREAQSHSSPSKLAALTPLVFGKYILSIFQRHRLRFQTTCCVLVIKCDCTTQQLTSQIRKGAGLAPCNPSSHRKAGLHGSESHPYLSLALSTPSCTSSPNILVLSLCPPRSTYPSSPFLLVECDSSMPSQPPFSPRSPSFSDSGADMHTSSFTTSLARLHLLAHRVSSYWPGCGVGWMNTSDSKNEKGRCEGKGRELIVRREGEEMWLVLTTCVGTGIDRGDRGRGIGEERRCIPDPFHLFESHRERPQQDDDRCNQKRLSLSPAESTPMFYPAQRWLPHRWVVCHFTPDPRYFIVHEQCYWTSYFQSFDSHFHVVRTEVLRYGRAVDPNVGSPWKWRNIVEFDVS